MKKILCIAQEHMFDKAELKKLEAGLKDIFENNYSTTEKAVVLWMLMPKGYAYSERTLSDAIIIMVEVQEGIEQKKREKLMGLFSRFLMDNFNVSPLDSLITVADSSFVNQFFEAQRKRARFLSRPMITLKILGTALTAKLIDGYFKLRVRV